MKNYLSILIVILSFLSLCGQSSVGFHFAVGQYSSLDPVTSIVGKNGGLSIAPGFDFQYKFNERLSVYGGIGLLTISEAYVNDNLRWGSEFDGQGGFTIDPTLPRSLKQSSVAFFIPVQVGVKYYFLQRKVKLFAQPYIESNFLLSSRTSQASYLEDGSTYSSKTTVNNVSQNENVVFGLGLGFGAEVDLGDKFSVYFVPDVKMLFTDISLVKNSKSLIPALKLGVWYKI